MYQQYNIGTDLLSEGSETVFNSSKTDFSLFYRGIVVSVNDPLKLGRARIRIPSLHGSNNQVPGYIPDMSLPWATPAVWSSSGNDMGTFDPPVAGTRVFVTFEGGLSQYPIYFGGIPTKIGNTKYYKPDSTVMMGAAQEITTDDYNLDFVTGTERVPFKSFKGATIIVDDFDGHEYIKIIDQSGQTLTMGNKGEALPRRNGELGTSSEAYIELTNNRGEKIRITDGEVFIDGDTTIINSPNVLIPHYDGGGGGHIDAYTRAETDALLANKSKVFFEQPTIPYNKDDIWYNGTTVYRCINTRKNGRFSIDDWELDTSFMTPDQVRTELTELENKIELKMSSTYVTKAYVDDKINYEIFIHSSNGEIFKNGVIDTVLTAYVRQGNKDVSTKFTDSQFIWSRVSEDEAGDLVWNRAHIGGSRHILVTSDDVQAKATFNCELVDDINTVNYVKSGLIEIFDGYDEPTSTGEWISMIRTNAAIIPSSGVTYNEKVHGYKFTGSGTSMQLHYPITFREGYTYEFVSELQSYDVIQNILCSPEDNNDNIQNRISCAVAGHLMLRKNGYRMSIGDVKVNRKAYVSMRFADEDNMEIYINGVYAGRYIQSNWDSTPGMFNNIGRYCNGYIHSIRVYNRLLTPQEIKTNYNEDRNRFE